MTDVYQVQELRRAWQAGGSGPGALQGPHWASGQVFDSSPGVPFWGAQSWLVGSRPQFPATWASPAIAQCRHRAADSDYGGSSGPV